MVRSLKLSLGRACGRYRAGAATSFWLLRKFSVCLEKIMIAGSLVVVFGS